MARRRPPTPGRDPESIPIDAYRLLCRFSGPNRIRCAAMTLLEICQAIENSSIGTSMRESNYYWMLNGTHVLGIAISAGAIFWFDLRAMGLNMRDMRVSQGYPQIKAWMAGGFYLTFGFAPRDCLGRTS